MPILDFLGKSDVLNHHTQVPVRLLREEPQFSFSSNNENSENLIVEGDNLEALRALLPRYGGQVKCIYIDPPYNTGNEGWAYNDNVNAPTIKQWLNKAVGRDDLSRHDKWLCMMLPRLKLLREFLRPDGAIFISIDDNEVHHLRCLLDEVFGEQNFVEIFSWQKTATPPSLSKKSRKTVEYILCYENRKSSEKYKGEEVEGGDQPLLNEGNTIRTLHFPRKSVFFKNLEGIFEAGQYERVRLVHPIKIDSGYATEDIYLDAAFKWTQETLNQEINKGTTFIIKSDKFSIRFIREYSDDAYKAPTNLIKEKYITPVINKANDDVDTNESASNDLENLLGKKVFNYPKPVSLVRHLINFCTSNDDIILDSFAGSGTTAQAVLELNKQDGGRRRFVLVEMESEIARGITAERVRRVAAGYTDAKGKQVEGTGGGFRFMRLGETLFDENGEITPSVRFGELAQYVFFHETGVPFQERATQANTPLLGVASGKAVYLLYNGILKDKTPHGGNALTRETLALLEKPTVPQSEDKSETEHETPLERVVYGTSCRLSPQTLAAEGIVFKQIPYSLHL